MSTTAEAFEKRVRKLFSNLPVVTQAKLINRLEKELIIIKERKIFNLFKAYNIKDGESMIALESIITDPTLSVVGYLTKTLHTYQQDESLSKLDQFLDKNNLRAACKMKSLSDAQVKELILAGAFGNPQVSMQTFCNKNKERMPDLDFDKEFAIRTGNIRIAKLADLNEWLNNSGFKKTELSTYADYLNSMNLDTWMLLAGQIVDLPKSTMTRKKEEMGFLSLHAIDTEEYENPKYDIVIWPERWAKFKNLNVVKGDIVIVAGKRGYNEKRKEPQMIGSIFYKMELKNNTWVGVEAK